MILIYIWILIIISSVILYKYIRHIILNNDAPHFSIAINEKVQSRVKEWLFDERHQFLKMRSKSEAVITEPYMGEELCKKIYSQNYKSFTSMDEVNQFVWELDTNPQKLYTNDFQLLVSKLIIEFGVDHIESVKQTCYRSVTYVDDSLEKLYRNIDDSYRYFWIFIYIQNILVDYRATFYS